MRSHGGSASFMWRVRDICGMVREVHRRAWAPHGPLPRTPSRATGASPKSQQNGRTED